MAAPRPDLRSAPFSHREFNGETLIAELASLREGQVRQKQLEDCAVALRSLKGLSVADATARLRQVATGRFQTQPALARLMVSWSGKLRTEADVTALVAHFQQLARVGALIAALRRRGERLVGGGAP